MSDSNIKTDCPADLSHVGDVRRVRDHNGSHIEPPLNPLWSNLDKLRWLAAVIQADHDLQLTVQERTCDRGEERFVVFASAPGRSWGSSYYDFDSAWRRISDLGFGAEVYRAQHGGPDA